MGREAAALRRSRCEILRSTLQVSESVAEVSGKIHFGPPKTYEHRWARLPRFVSEMLAAHLARNVADDPDTLVFTSPKGNVLRARNFRERAWNSAVESLGDALPKGLTPHHLRHTCASLLIARGASVKAVQQQLGHSTPAVTLNVYTQLFDDDLDDLFRDLDEPLREAVTRPGVAEMWPKRRSQGSRARERGQPGDGLQPGLPRPAGRAEL